MNRIRLVSGIALAALLTLCACGSTPQTSQRVPQIDVSGARAGIVLSLSLMKTAPGIVRPAALLAVYTNILLATQADVPVHAAMDGIEAQLKLHSLPTAENVDDLYGLLDEFGAVLHVNIADLLNRSDDRAKTLDEYSIGLKNITERSTRRAADVKEQLGNLKTQSRDQKRDVSTIDKEIKNAVKAKDFSTAQAKQKELRDAQAELTETDLTIKEMTDIQNTFTELIDIAQKRSTALEQNREILIAGLRVVDVPGVEDLGVLNSKKSSSRRTGGANPFGGL